MKKSEISWSLMHPIPLNPDYIRQLVEKSARPVAKFIPRIRHIDTPVNLHYYYYNLFRVAGKYFWSKKE